MTTEEQKKQIEEFHTKLEKICKKDFNRVPEVEVGFHEGRPYRIFGKHDDKTLEQFFNALGHELGISGTLCADGHYGYGQPIGSAIRYNGVSVSGVGYDIGCGLLSRSLTYRYESLLEAIPNLHEIVSNNLDRDKNSVTEGLHEMFEYKYIEDDLRKSKLFSKEELKDLKEAAYSGIGTLGNGNHFLNLVADLDGTAQLITHTGSRSFGHMISQKFYDLAGYKDSDSNPLVFSSKDDLYLPYRVLVATASTYASYNRSAIIQKIANSIISEVQKIGKAYEIESDTSYKMNVSTIHNCTSSHLIGGSVSYKGCTTSTQGLIASSMADPIYHVRSVAIPQFGSKSSEVPFANPHGSGRLFSRRRAKKELSKETQMNILKERGIELIGGDIDESPECYRDVKDVMKAHGLNILEVYTPKLVIMNT